MLSETDTIAAIATAPGHGARCIVRMSGPASVPALRAMGVAMREATPASSNQHEPSCSLLDSGTISTRAAHARAVVLTIPASIPSHAQSTKHNFNAIPDADAPADRAGADLLPCPALLAWFPAGKSYTGQDSAELTLAGSPDVASRVLRALCAQPGVRAAGPGEFSARAFGAGRLTQIEAEAIAAKIAATSEHELHAAQQLERGETGRDYAELAVDIASALALVEAGIDFTDQEDVVPIDASTLAARCEELIARSRGLMGLEGADAASIRASTPSAGPRTSRDMQRSSLPVVVLAGEPNAGKSTLFNALLGRARAVASPVAGTTRDVLEEELCVGFASATRVLLRDIAGLEATSNSERVGADRGMREDADSDSRSFSHSTVPSNTLSREPSSACTPSPVSTDANAQTRAMDALREADVVLWCDPAGEFDAQGSVATLLNAVTNVYGFSTSSLSEDSLPAIIRVRTMADRVPSVNVRPTSTLPVCALDGWNIPLLRDAIAQHATHARASGIAHLLPRHAIALLAALDAITTARSLALASRASALAQPELIADALRAALDAMGELTKPLSPDYVLGRIFAGFCIGK